MDGFKATFSDLFSSSNDQDQITGSGDTYYVLVNETIQTANYSSSFCGSPDDIANATKTCGSGNGADSASTIVGSYSVE